jgi:hypothetical protein
MRKKRYFNALAPSAPLVVLLIVRSALWERSCETRDGERRQRRAILTSFDDVKERGNKKGLPRNINDTHRKRSVEDDQ